MQCVWLASGCRGPTIGQRHYAEHQASKRVGVATVSPAIFHPASVPQPDCLQLGMYKIAVDAPSSAAIIHPPPDCVYRGTLLLFSRRRSS